MVSLAKLLKIRQEIEKNYKNMGLEKFLLSIEWNLNLTLGAEITNKFCLLVFSK
jgi:hypothetical protein